MELEVQSLLKKSNISFTTGEYQRAKEYLDDILLIDSNNAEAWYEKSKLPILQEDTIIIEGCSISVSQYYNCDVSNKLSYLQQCGLSLSKAISSEHQFQYNILIEKEHLKYLKMAVSCATSNQDIYKSELESLIAKQNNKGLKETRVSVRVGLITLPFIILVLSFLIYVILNIETRYLMFINIGSIIPYALSIIGLTFYTKVKQEGKKTKMGFTTNVVSLILSNITIITSVIFLIINYKY
jgi:hypothetical protein